MAASLPRIQAVEGELRFAGFVDVETTGLDPDTDEVVEFAISLFAFQPHSGEIVGIVDQYSGLRDPGRPIPSRASAIHGIGDADVKGKRLNDRLIRALVGQSEFLIAHNASFDRPFVERLYPEARDKIWLCSMNGVPWKRLGFPSKGLQNLLKAHGINPGRAHRGLDDVEAALALLSTTARDGTQYFRYVLERYRASGSPSSIETERVPSANFRRSSWLGRLFRRATRPLDGGRS